MNRLSEGTEIPKQAMVLAAGLGRRMRPLTDNIPKPLVEVGGKSLIDRALDRLDAVGVERAVVNVHHLAEQVEAHAAARTHGPAITISDERGERLETGGGVKKALGHFGDQPFYVVNSDVIWRDGVENTLADLARHWDGAKMDALLLMVPAARALGYKGEGDYHMDASGRLRWRGERIAPFVFGGIQILHPRLFSGAPDGAFSLKRLYDAAEERERLHGVAHGGMWIHVGEPTAVALAEAALDG